MKKLISSFLFHTCLLVVPITLSNVNPTDGTIYCQDEPKINGVAVKRAGTGCPPKNDIEYAIRKGNTCKIQGDLHMKTCQCVTDTYLYTWPDSKTTNYACNCQCKE